VLSKNGVNIEPSWSGDSAVSRWCALFVFGGFEKILKEEFNQKK
jgi:hypothetical protein